MGYSIPHSLDTEDSSPRAFHQASRGILDRIKEVEDKGVRWSETAVRLTGESFDAVLAGELIDEIQAEIRSWSNSDREQRTWDETLEAARAELTTSHENALSMIYQTICSIDSYLRDPLGIAAHVFRESEKLSRGQHLYSGDLITYEAESIAKLSANEAEAQIAACGTLSLEASTGLSSVSLIDNPGDLQRKVAEIKTIIDRTGADGKGTRIESDRNELDGIGRRLQALIARFDALLRDAPNFTWRELQYKTVDTFNQDPSYFSELLRRELSADEIYDFVENLRVCFCEFEALQKQLTGCLNRLDFNASKIRDALQVYQKELKTLGECLMRLERVYSLPSQQ